MTITFLLIALIFRFAVVLLDVFVFFLVVRIICEFYPAPLVENLNHAGKPLIDGVIATIVSARRKFGLGHVRDVRACAIALAVLSLLQIMIALIVR